MSSAAQPGPLALVGSGEFLPQMAEIDRWLLAGRPPRAAFLATAAGLEGPETVSRWLALGVEHYRRLGVVPVPVPVIERADADDPDHAAAFEGCGLVYLSGGHPAYLAATLRGTAVWAAIERAWRAGAALAGCSAGAMALSAEAPSVRGDRPDEPGLALVAHVAVIPHFDRIAAWDPTLVARRTARPTPGRTVVGIDEDTALVGGPQRWTVMGRGTVTVFEPAGPVVHHPGDVVLLEP
ncbi:MAG: Type 1 glutamine amidotransferase-like domain-containing protein [Acidimicrobiia bacterium]